jgi:hypothetical protein
LRAGGYQDIRLKANQVRRHFGKYIFIAFGKPPFNDDALSFNVTKLLQPPTERFLAFLDTRAASQISDPINFALLLRIG